MRLKPGSAVTMGARDGVGLPLAFFEEDPAAEAASPKDYAHQVIVF